MDKDRFATEFGRYTNWIVEAVTALRIQDAVPAACRGTGHPVLLAELADAICARPGMLVLDAGCGMGGPAAWLRLHRGCITVGIDLMEENVRAARVLFDDRMSMVSSANGLPFEDDTFDAVWAVGVLEMLREKERAFVECARVLRPGGRMVVYTFTAQAADLSERPSANAFASPAAVSSIVRRVGLEVMDARPWPVHSPPPAGWTAVRAAVADEVRARHGLEDDFGRVRAELDTFNRLRSSREIEPWRYVLLKLAR